MKRIITIVGTLFVLLFSLLALSVSAQAETPVTLAPYTSPVSGNAHYLAIVVSFPGTTPAEGITTETVDAMMFDTRCDTQTTTGFDSVHSFFYRSSFGKLNISGDTIAYTMKREASYYPSGSEIEKEILTETGDLFDLSQYDGDNSGHADAIFILYDSYNCDAYGGYVSSASDVERDGVKAGPIVHLGYIHVNVDTLIHETCHTMGSPDIYGGVGVNIGSAHAESVMTNGTGKGDIPGPLKFLYGWMPETSYVSALGSTVCELSSASTTPQMTIVYPNGDTDCDYVYVIEYITPEMNNVAQHIDDNGGLRIWQADIAYDENGNIHTPGTFFHFINALCPSERPYYYYTDGESVTPYTAPTTYKASTYTSDNARNSIPLDRSFSGISVTDIHIADGKAQFKVTIEESPSVTTSEFTYKMTEESSLTMLFESNITLLRVSNPADIIPLDKVPYLLDEEGNNIPLQVSLDLSLMSLSVSLDKEQFNTIDKEKSFTLVVPAGCFSTSFGAENAAKSFPISFSDFVLTAEELSRGSINGWYAPYLTYTTQTGSVVSISEDIYTDTFYCSNINPSSLTYTQTELEVYGVAYRDSPVYYASLSDDSFVIIFSSPYLLYINRYDPNGTLLQASTYSYNNESEILSIKGGWNDNIVIQRRTGKIQLNLLTMQVEELQHIPTGINIARGIGGDKYLLFDSNRTFLADSTGILASREEACWYRAAVYEDGKIYMFDTYNQQLTVYVYDMNLQLLSSEVVCSDLPIVNIRASIVYVTDSYYILAFNPSSNSGGLNYSNAVVLYLDKNLKLTDYYKFGENTAGQYGSTALVENNNVLIVTSHAVVKVFPKSAACEEHQYETETLAPTCTAEGYSKYTCAACGYTYTEILGRIAHTTNGEYIHYNSEYHLLVCSICRSTWLEKCTVTDVVHAPTCIWRGFTTHTCSVCGYSYNNNYIPATGHTFGEFTVFDSRSHQQVCTICGSAEYETCSFVESEHKDATCVEKGYDISRCSVCANEDIKYIPPLGHSYGDFTHNEDNTHTKLCTTCGDKVTEACQFYVSSRKYQNCTEDGFKISICSVCGYNETTIYKAFGHSLNPPVSNRNGTHKRTCRLCREDVTEDCAYIHTEQNATCTEDGYSAYTCSVCGYNDTTVYKATGHRTVTPVSNNNGTHTGTCTVCGEHLTEGCVYIYTGHTATCTEDGYGDCSCSVCGFSTTTVYKATGHSLNPPVSNNNGTHTRTCTVCGEHLMEGCAYIYTGHTATCTEDGYTDCSCSVCGYSTKRTEQTALGHVDTDGDGLCDRCDIRLTDTPPEEPTPQKSFFDKLREFFQKIIEFFSNLF